MPYIPKFNRTRLDPGIDALIGEIANAGELNYVISRLVDGFVHAQATGRGERVRYEDHNAAVGVLQSAAYEYYRRRVAPYEDNAAATNGEVYR